VDGHSVIMTEPQKSSEVELTTCNVCSKTFHEPKLLSCLDTFCYKCLEKLLSKESQVPRSVICPTCGVSTTVPDNGLHGLPDNSFVATLIEIKKLNEEQKNRKLACSACSRKSTETAELDVAVVFCVVCEDKLCKTCSDAHRKLKITTDHRLVPLDEDFMTKLSEARQSKPTCCQEHRDQLYTLYCQNIDCQKPICLKCAVLTHKSHNYIDIAEVAKGLRKDLLKAAEGLRGKHESLEHQSQILKTRKDVVQESTNKVEALLGQQYDDVLLLIENCRKELDTSAQDIHGQNMHILQEAEMALNSRISDLESALSFGHVLSQMGDDVEISCMLQPFQLKADQVRSQQSRDLPEDLEIQLSFNVARHTDGILNKTPAVLGSVTVTQDNSRPTEDTTASDTSLTEAAEAEPHQSSLADAVHSEDVDYKRQQDSMLNWKSLRLINTIKGRDPVRGIAIIGDQLFVVHRSASTVEIYNADSLASVGTLDVNGLNNATDMAACSITKHIYISDKSLSKVFHLRLLSDCKWRVDEYRSQKQPFGLSVTPNCHVFVAYPYNECFAEFSADWYQLRVVEMPGLKPLQVVFLAENHFVTCGGDFCNSVSIYSLDGQKSTVGNAVAVCRHELNTFKRPTHIAVDANRCIFVVDSHQHRIVVTDSKLSKTLRIFRNGYTNGLEKFCLNTATAKLYGGISNCMRDVTVSQYILQR